MRGRTWQVARPLVLWWGGVLALGVVGALAFDLLEDVAIGMAGDSLGAVVVTAAALISVQLGIGVLFGSTVSAVHFTLVVQVAQCLVTGGPNPPPELQRQPPGLGRLVWGGVAAMLLMVLATSVWILGRLEEDRPVLVIAHRGSSAAAPENSLAAIRQAIEDGADYAEIDVQETADGVVVVLHDSDLQRITGLQRRIWEVTYEEVAGLDAGSWFDATFAGERIPTLQQAIEVARGRIGLNIELKFNGHDQQLAERVVQIVQEQGLASEAMIMSLDLEGLRTVRAIDPELEIGALVAQSVGDLLRLDVDFVAFEEGRVSREIVGELRGAGKKVFLWTINDPGAMLGFLALGIDGIITDVPAVLVKLRDEIDALPTVERLVLAYRSRLER